MPKATVSMEATRYDLKSLPGGFVMLKQLSFGQMLKRRDRAAKFYQEQSNGNAANARTQIDILNEISRQFDFAHCIVDHNLEDDSGNKLTFTNSATLDILDPRIASEIERYIDAMNQEDFNEGDFTATSDASLTQTSSASQEDEG